MIMDVDIDHTNSVTFTTKHGKKVEFVKVVRCRDCKFYKDHWCRPNDVDMVLTHNGDAYCWQGKRRDE